MAFPSESELKAIEDRAKVRRCLDDHYRSTIIGDGPTIETRQELAKLLTKQQDPGFKFPTSEQDIKYLLNVIRDLYSLHKSAGMVQIKKDS